MGRLSPSEAGEMVLDWDLRLFHLTLNFLQIKQTVQTLIRRRSVSDAAHCGV